MKRTFCAIVAVAALLFANTLMAQEQTGTEEEIPKKKKGHSISISNKGIKVETTDSAKAKAGKIETKDKDHQGRFATSVLMFDLGINLLSDNTDYSDPSLSSYVHVPGAKLTKSLFDLRSAKSVNVNITPWMLKYTAVKTHGQRIYVSTGVGLQFYNFRYEQPLTYVKNPAGIILDTISFKKDKLALTYLNVPLMFTFKTRLYKDHWLVYGVGLTEGYRIGSLNKQVSDQRGKVKTRGSFGLADFNTCLNAEFGVEGIVRFFASYQLTSLYENGLDQHPISIGFRLSGI